MCILEKFPLIVRDTMLGKFYFQVFRFSAPSFYQICANKYLQNSTTSRALSTGTTRKLDGKQNLKKT